ncbi:MAG: hypothetical protein JNL50_07615 [Phycisphaerae bacterium]|nr:hypothetical protein [Phycisphaerae bacterium]
MRKLAWPLVILMVALVIQLGLTLHGVTSITTGSFSTAPVRVINLSGQDATNFPLPAPPAPGQPAWPPAHQVQIERLSPLIDRIGTWHVDAEGMTTHQMSVDRVGYPPFRSASYSTMVAVG